MDFSVRVNIVSVSSCKILAQKKMERMIVTLIIYNLYTQYGEEEDEEEEEEGREREREACD